MSRSAGMEVLIHLTWSASLAMALFHVLYPVSSTTGVLPHARSLRLLHRSMMRCNGDQSVQASRAHVPEATSADKHRELPCESRHGCVVVLCIASHHAWVVVNSNDINVCTGALEP